MLINIKVGFEQKVIMRKTLLLSMFSLFSVTRCQQPTIELSGQEGGLIHISCSYDEGYETYTKYFSKGLYGHRKVVVKTTDKMCRQTMQKRKYDLCDDTKKRILNVTIYDLTLRDAGTYWCEIDAYGFDPKMKIELQVHKVTVNSSGKPSEDVHTVKVTPTSGVKITAYNHHLLFLTVVMCAAAMLFVCLFTLCLLLAVKHRRSAQRQNREASSDYETMMPGVRREPELLSVSPAPDSSDVSASPPPPPDLCCHITAKNQESTVSLSLGEYVDVDVPGNICQYQHLDLS